MPSIESFRAGLDADTRAMVDRLRGIVATACPQLTERLKWNAPSFALGDDDRLTLGIERKGGVRLVLHRGAKPKNLAGFRFDDVDGLAKWPSPDRGVIVWQSLAAIDEAEHALARLCRRWLEAVG